MAKFNVTLNTNEATYGFDLVNNRSFTMRGLAKFLEAFACGSKFGTLTLQDDGASTAASGTLTLSTASGTVGGIINGVTITVTAAGGDTATATLIANAINASGNALVSGLVTASSVGAVVTVSSVLKGKVGNQVTLAASGSGVTASGARLAGGVDATIGSVTL